MDINEFTERVKMEYDSAKESHPMDIHSPHEAYAIILKQLDDYWSLVKRNSYRGYEYRQELIQIAAMCYTALKEVHGS